MTHSNDIAKILNWDWERLVSSVVAVYQSRTLPPEIDTYACYMQHMRAYVSDLHRSIGFNISDATAYAYIIDSIGEDTNLENWLRCKSTILAYDNILQTITEQFCLSQILKVADSKVQRLLIVSDFSERERLAEWLSSQGFKTGIPNWYWASNLKPLIKEYLTLEMSIGKAATHATH